MGLHVTRKFRDAAPIREEAKQTRQRLRDIAADEKRQARQERDRPQQLDSVRIEILRWSNPDDDGEKLPWLRKSESTDGWDAPEEGLEEEPLEDLPETQSLLDESKVPMGHRTKVPRPSLGDRWRGQPSGAEAEELSIEMGSSENSYFELH